MKEYILYTLKHHTEKVQGHIYKAGGGLPFAFVTAGRGTCRLLHQLVHSSSD